MKKILYTLAIAALALASCSKEAIEKADVEAGFAAKKELPTVKIVSVGEYNKLDDYLPVQVSFSGVAGLEDLSMGLLISTDPTFTSSKFVPIDAAADGTYTVELKGTAKKTNYFMAAAASADGAGYSEAKSFDFPDIAWFKKIVGTYSAKNVADAWDETYDFKVSIVLDETDPEHKARIVNLDPYFFDKGFTYEKQANFIEVVIDEQTHTLVGAAGQSVGYKDCVFYGYTDTDEVIVEVDEEGTAMVIKGGVGVYSESAGGWYSLFEGDITLTK